MTMVDEALKKALIEAYRRMLERQSKTEAEFTIPPSERVKLYVNL